jgi:2-C-methyl-D-erythritol 4-phosphate cytidylyltransferase
MKKFAVIVAGGTGARMNSAIPKQFLLVQNKPLIYYSILRFLESFDDMRIILVLPFEFISMGQEVIDGYFDRARIQITAGGRTRFHSVQNGLNLVEEESIIFVHDGARCLVSIELIQRCYDKAVEYGTAIPAVTSRDSIRVLLGGENSPVDRDTIRMVQTPQTFHSKILLPAYKIDYKDKFTDEATVVEAFGLKVHLIEGDENNIKITHPADLVIANALLLEQL